MNPSYPFQKLEVYRLALDYLNSIYKLGKSLNSNCPDAVRSQLTGAATQIVTTIASRSAGKSEIEKSFMVDGCSMSLYETIACLDIIESQHYAGKSGLTEARKKADVLSERLTAMKKMLKHR